MKGEVLADIHTNCGGTFCYNRGAIRHTAYRHGVGAVVECSRCYVSRPATDRELWLVQLRLDGLRLASQGQEVPSYAL